MWGGGVYGMRNIWEAGSTGWSLWGGVYEEVGSINVASVGRRGLWEAESRRRRGLQRWGLWGRWGLQGRRGLGASPNGTPGAA